MMIQTDLQDRDEFVRGDEPSADAAVRGDSAEAPLPMHRPSASKVSSARGDLDRDELIKRYFNELSRSTLLSWTEEQALWQRLEGWRAQARRALYLSPHALSTLIELWQQVKHGELALQQVVARENDKAQDDAAAALSLEQSIEYLQDVASQLRQLYTQRRAASHSAHKRRAVRRCQVRVWRAWLDRWDQIHLRPSVHDKMRHALDLALQAQPTHPGLRATHRRWTRAEQEITRLTAQMLQANLRLVVHVAKRYRDQGVSFLDLIQEGNIGLMRALEKFEPQRGLKFVTYAYWWIRQALGRAILDQRGLIRLPNYMAERRQTLYATSDKLWQVHGRTPSSRELCAALGWTPHEIKVVQDSQPLITRLHDAVTDDGRMLQDVVKDDQALCPDAHVADKELKQRVVASLGELPEREAKILRLRFGLDTDRAYSLREIGEQFNLSRERIRQLETIALQKLKQSPHGALLADYV